jgi:hypothetical protein
MPRVIFDRADHAPTMRRPCADNAPTMRRPYKTTLKTHNYYRRMGVCG